ncbi:MAG: WbqC family protein [Pyrinomonadaceae bacterium]
MSWSWEYYVKTMTGSNIVAIHQPTFFPWLGFFNKIHRANVFVILDNVQFSKKGGTWANRVKLLVGAKPKWITMPVDRNYHGVRTYGEMMIDNGIPWRDKLLKTIHFSYGRAPHFAEVFPTIESLVSNPTPRLTDYNLSAILYLVKVFGIDVSKIVFASSLKTEGTATDLLISIVKAANGTAYLCGGGAGGYQEDEKFAAAGLNLIYQNFQHPVYEQISGQNFVTGLSVIDALMNCGFRKTGELVGNA